MGTFVVIFTFVHYPTPIKSRNMSFIHFVAFAAMMCQSIAECGPDGICDETSVVQIKQWPFAKRTKTKEQYEREIKKQRGLEEKWKKKSRELEEALDKKEE